MRTATRLAGIDVPVWRGEPVRLGSPWQQHPVVRIFIHRSG